MKTKDYSIFKTIMGNRSIYPNHVKRLINSIRENNLLEKNPILVNSKMEVIDGQHRLLACEELEIPVHYVKISKAGLREVHLLNATARAWQTRDYVNSYVDLGVEDYIKLKEFKEKWGINYTTCANLLQFGKAHSGKSRPGVRDGEFEVRFEKEAHEIMKYVSLFNDYTDGVTLLNGLFISAVSDLMLKGFTHDTVTEKLLRAGRRIYRANTKAEYLRQLEGIFNVGKSTNLLRF